MALTGDVAGDFPETCDWEASALARRVAALEARATRLETGLGLLCGALTMLDGSPGTGFFPAQVKQNLRECRDIIAALDAPTSPAESAIDPADDMRTWGWGDEPEPATPAELPRAVAQAASVSARYRQAAAVASSSMVASAAWLSASVRITSTASATAREAERAEWREAMLEAAAELDAGAGEYDFPDRAGARGQGIREMAARLRKLAGDG